MLAARGGESGVAAPLCLTQARRRVRIEQEREEQEQVLQVCTPLSSVHSSVPPAQVFLCKQPPPGAPRVPRTSPDFSPHWKPTGDIKAALSPAYIPGGKLPHGSPQVATSWGTSEGPSQLLPRQCRGRSLHRRLSLCHSPARCAGRGDLQPKSSSAPCSSSIIPACSPTPSPLFTPRTSTSPWGRAKARPSQGKPHH